jgi:alpha-L-rhamnosidase
LKYATLILTFVFFVASAVWAQPGIKTNWQAQWISDGDSVRQNIFQRYRKKFVLLALPASASASIAVDSKYWLWVNGKLIVFEGGLKRGPTPTDTYYDEVNIRPFLKTGENTIAILVWYWGKHGFCHNSSGQPGLLFELAADGHRVLSDASWKTARHKAYGNTGAPRPNYRLPEHNVHYDARVDNEDWIHPFFNDASWHNATIAGNAGAAPWNRLWKRPIPLWYNSGLKPYQSRFKFSDTGKLVMQLPKNLTVTPYFKIEAPPGLLIDIRTDNYLGGSEPNVRTEYVTKAGVQEFESPAYFNGHQVIYSFPPGVKIMELQYRETKYNTAYTGFFTSSDSFLNTLWVKAANTMNVNMRDAIQDPDRERAQWWGDVVIILEEIFYACDSNGPPAVRKAISNLLEWQRPDSVLFSPVPAGNWNKELPAQMLASIGKYGIWKYIVYSGDTAMIRYAYPFIKKYMGLWELNEDGLVKHRSGGWDWHDWGDKIDVPLLDNTWYYMALESCYNMAAYLGLKADAQHYMIQMQTVKTAFQKSFWKGNHFASDGYKFFADDRGNGLAVCAGLVSPVQWRAMKPVLDTTFHAGPYLEKYILESYFIMGDGVSGIARMKKRYDKMVNHPVITTLWEGWEIGSATYGGGTYNHGWTGGPLSLMSGYIAGIRAETIGYEKYSIRPQPSGLARLSAGAQTPKGFVKVQVQKNKNRLVMQVETIDANGLVAVPKAGNKFRVRGRTRPGGLRFLKEDDHWFYFTCSVKGRWKVIVK